MPRGHTFQLTCVMLSGRQVVLQARKHHKIASICERLADELNVPKMMLVYKGEVLAGGPAELRRYYISMTMPPCRLLLPTCKRRQFLSAG